MSTIKVDTIATRTGSGNITLSNSLASATVAGDLTVDGNTLHVDSSNNKVGLGVDPGTMPSFITHAALVPNGGGIGITSPAAGNNRLIYFGTGTSSSDVQLAAIKNTTSDIMFLGASGAEKARILNSGGITFNGDTAAANALDDYEEGSWTPAVSTASTHHSRTGQYTKIGNMVHIQCVIHFTQSGTTFGSISGLPYVVSGINYSPITFREWYSTGITLSGNLVIGGQSTSGMFNYANSSTAVNNQQYGYSLSTTYRTNS